MLGNHVEDLPTWLHPRCLAILDISENGFQHDIALEQEQYVIDKSRNDLRSLVKKYSEEKYKHILVYGKKEEESKIFPINLSGNVKIKVPLEDFKVFF